MTIRHRLMVLFALAVVVFTVVMAGDVVHKTRVVDLNITTAGDTAQITRFKTFAGVDSFKYIDTFSYQADTGAHQTIAWVAPVQVMSLTPTLDVTTTYACSVGFATDTLGFVLDPVDIEITTLALLIDTMVYLFNNTTNLKDSILAEDSVTYVKLVSKFSQTTFTARWKAEFGVTGGTGTLDTAGTITTVAMVADSMVSYVNADAGLDSFMTATNAGDTAYLVTSDDPGVLFYAADLDIQQETSADQANVTSYSVATDTFDLARIIYTDKEYNSLTAMFILDTPATESQGINGGDSAYIWLYTVFNGEYFLLAGDSVATGLCTLRAVLVHAAGSDTLFKEYFALGYRMADTASDTTARFNVNLHMDLILREE